MSATHLKALPGAAEMLHSYLIGKNTELKAIALAHPDECDLEALLCLVRLTEAQRLIGELVRIDIAASGGGNG